MALAIERKRLISSSLYFLLWIIAVMLFYFSKKILINTNSRLLEITKSGKKIPIRKNHHTNKPNGIMPYSLSRSFAMGRDNGRRF